MKIIERIKSFFCGKHIKICSREAEVKITFTIAPNKCLEVKDNDAILRYSFETEVGIFSKFLSGGGGGSCRGLADFTISPNNLTVHETFGDINLGDANVDSLTSQDGNKKIN